MTASINRLRAAGVLSPLDVQLARILLRLESSAASVQSAASGETAASASVQSERVALAAALVSRQVSQGHVCFSVAESAALAAEIAGTAGEGAVDSWPEPGVWLETLAASPLVGDGSEPTPLVLDGAGRLYLHRYHDYQVRLARELRRRAGETNEAVDAVQLRDGLDRLFPPDSEDSDRDNDRDRDWQRTAALVAVLRRLCIVSGGPGTGKTATVVRILALLVEQAFAQGAPPPRVALLAPTGKAAARLAESIREQVDSLACDAEVLSAIPREARTIHRALGVRRGARGGTRHHRDDPLPADVVVLDEASMVDLALMTRLAEAVPLRARLILLGDRDQLASVEAGSVLGDLCGERRATRYSAGFAAEVATMTGDRLPVLGVAKEKGAAGVRAVGPLTDCVAVLSRSRRFGTDSGIGALARAVVAGDGEAALGVLEGDAYPDVARLDPRAVAGLAETLRERSVAELAAVLAEADPRAQLAALAGFRVLCAHRRGPEGCEGINRAVEAALVEAGHLQIDAPDYAGRPILVTRNDVTLGIFNGDTGIVVPGSGEEPRAAFAAADEGEVRTIATARLPEYETAYASTIHRSQGSEYARVAVVLPARRSPILTRELLYTAVTRARERVEIYATREAILEAIARPVRRASGLRDAVWGPG